MSQSPAIFGSAAACRAAEHDDAALDGRRRRLGCAIAAARARRARGALDARPGPAVETRGKRERPRSFRRSWQTAPAAPRRGPAGRSERAPCRARAAWDRRCARRPAMPRQSALPSSPAFTGMRATGASAAPCTLPAAITRVRRLPLASDGGRDRCLAAPAERRPGERRRLDLAVAHPEIAADVGRLERLLPVPQRDAVEVRHHRHDAPVEILDRQDHRDVRLHRPGARQIGEHRAEGRRERRRLQHADRSARVDLGLCRAPR